MWKRIEFINVFFKIGIFFYLKCKVILVRDLGFLEVYRVVGWCFKVLWERDFVRRVNLKELFGNEVGIIKVKDWGK